jgi:ketosteroid isomerase-like protein
MSQQNVETVRSVLSEFAETQKLSELVSPEAVWDLGSWSAWSGQLVFHGREGFLEFFAEWTGAYEDWRTKPESFIDAGDDQVVVTSVQRGRMPGSGSWVQLRTGFVYTVADGLVVRGEVYGSPEEALEAAGLKE